MRNLRCVSTAKFVSILNKWLKKALTEKMRQARDVSCRLLRLAMPSQLHYKYPYARSYEMDGLLSLQEVQLARSN